MRMLVSVFGPLLASLTLVACFDPAGGGSGTTDATTSTDDAPATCVPGELRPCVCPEGMSNQECNAEGTAFGPCQCEGIGDETSTSDGGTTSTPGTTDGTTGPGGSSSSGPGDTTMGLEGTTGPDVTTSDGGTTDPVGSSSSGGGFGPLAIGEACTDDADCMTGVCWDFADYDPLCFGTACSLNCVSDIECVNAMALAGAPNPMASSCGFDGRCSTLGTGFGAYACAAAP